jgi:nucleotide-binding universal stress UspA family protein
MTEATSVGVNYRKILVTTDGSDHSFTAGKHAVYLAKNLGAEVVVLNVVNVDQAFHSGIHFAESVAMLEQAGNAAISRIEALCRENAVVCRGLILRGDPLSVILTFASEEKVDCIVMGSIGMSAIERVLVGSVSERVLRHAKCPVLVVRS